MENFAMESNGSLKLAEEKFEKLDFLFGQVKANAYLILEFSSECGELNDHLRTVKECLVERGKRVDLGEKQLEEREEQLRRWSEEVESKSKCVDEKIREFEAMERDKGLLEREIEECNLRLLYKESELASVLKELSAKGQQLAGVQKSLEGSRTELQDKETQLVSVGIILDESKKSLEACNKELVEKNENLARVQLLVKACEAELESTSQALRNRSSEVDSKAEELVVARKSLKSCSQMLESRKHDLERTYDLIRHRSKELKSKEKELDEVQKSVQKKSKELGEEVSRLDSIKELILENNEELEKKEEQYESMTCVIEKICQKRDLAEEQLRKIRGSIKESVKDLELKKGHLNSITIDIEEKTKKFQEMESQCNDAQKELHLVNQSVEKAHDKLKAKQAEHRVLEEQENSLRRAVAKYFEEHGSSEKELDSVRKTLEECHRKLMLTQAELFPRQLENLEDECLLPSIQVKIEKAEAMQDSNAINSLSVNFQPDDTTDGRSLFAIINDGQRIMKLMESEASETFFGLQNPTKLVLDMFRREGFLANMLRERFQVMVYLMQVSSKVTSQVKDASIPLAKRWKSGMTLEDENPMEAMAFLLFLIVYGVADSFTDKDILELIMMIAQSKQAPEICRRLGFANRMPDFIRVLIQKKRHMDAARFICSFGLASEFPIEPLLKRFIEKGRMEAWISNYEMNSLKDLDWFVDSELKALRAISSFILEYKLDFASVDRINDQMAKLENKRISRRLRTQTLVPLVSQHAQAENYCPEATSGFINPQVNAPCYQPYPQSLLQLRQKRPRTDAYSDMC